MNSECLAENIVEVRKGHEVIHRECVGFYRQKFFPELVLGLLVLRKGIEAPGDSACRRLVSCDEETKGIFMVEHTLMIFATLGQTAHTLVSLCRGFVVKIKRI